MTSHSEHVLQQLCSQLEYGFLCDCSIAVGDVRFRAHRVVLAACSSYFHKLFVNQPADSCLVSLSSQAVSPDHFDLILQLMYTGHLDSSPADLERFRASLRFLKLYNASRFQPTVGERECEGDGPTHQASGKPLVFGVQLYQDKAVGQSQAPATIDRPVSVKAELPDEAADPQAYLCHHCGLAFEEQAGLREHLGLHAERPLHCPLCGLAFEQAPDLQEHMCECVRQGRLVKREEEERPSRVLGPKPKVEEGPAAGGSAEDLRGLRPWGLEAGEPEAEGSVGRRAWGEAEDYVLEEGEVRFPGDDDLVLENATDDSISSSESSAEGEGEGEVSEGSDEEARAAAESSTVDAPPDPLLSVPPLSSPSSAPVPEPPVLTPAEGRQACQAARRKGKAWRCRTCEGCCEERGWDRRKRRRRRREEEEGTAASSSQTALSSRTTHRQGPLPKHARGPAEGGLSTRLAGPAYAKAFPRELRLQLAGRSGDARFKCSVCGHRSSRKYGHLVHMDTHLSAGQAVCQVCYEILPGKAELQRHLESHMYPCGVCGEKFRLKKDMVAHAITCWSRKLHGTEPGRAGAKN
ncbi:zinc finger and BTB domain-containing protein 1-like [Leucoraja erinacea]|uniref:zinc finger and BTB domain-containing protein 1-like n=1 Tax=Leucoraja erinaceus TaxID=7782 RepID=UPI002455F843|nr:zinc finger and BTB domain-containing protein 1-like [Leucoraja erinacea]XP_055519523.1 zinc finger and BTB domain-containing protein 1-like [Leucoraja erinacea]